MDIGRRQAIGGAGALALLALAGGRASAQGGPLGTHEGRSWRAASHVVMPQARGFSMRSGVPGIAIERVHAAVEIVEQAARTTLSIELRNPGPARAEAVLLLPVPEGAAVSGFDFDGAGSEPSARLLPADEARATYDEIVRRVKDPALLEFAGWQLVRSSVFPVEAGGTQHVRLTYEHLLESDGERVDYVLPRSESLAAPVPWDVMVRVRSEQPISMVYSPSHELESLPASEARKWALRTKPGGEREPGSFRLSFLRQTDGVSASLIAYPDPEVGGGFFLLMAGLPARIADAGRELRREVTVVLDRSGSMAGEKMDQARAAALQVIEGLEEGESFNIVDYSSQVATFAPGPVRRTRESVLAARAYLASIRPNGGTNVHDALLEALRQPHTEGTLPIVLFLTDGLPTVGRTSEVQIRDMVAQANVAERRIFTFGVGNDVNVPLLDRISDATRASATYVLPGEDVELKVAKVYRRLYGPVLADVELEVLGRDGAVDTRRVRELMPQRVPDLFEGDQLVLLGQYRGEEPLRFRLSGNFLGTKRTFAFRFGLQNASTRNAFVPRLWASRRIAFLADQIRQAGAVATAGTLQPPVDVFSDPRFAEIAEEILRLSTRYGILSEYTSFLATEGTELSDWGGLVATCNTQLELKAVNTRHGQGAVSQGRNFNAQKFQSNLNYSNRFWTEDNARTEFVGVQQICDRAFFKRGASWVDARLVGEDATAEPDQPVEEVAFGSERHRAILDQLVSEGRQGLLSLSGDVLMEFRGGRVLVHNGGGQ